jgi:uncharacterized membrane protein
MKVLGRYPAVILGVVSSLIQMLVAFGLPWSETQTIAVNAGVAALLGVVTAFYVARDRLLPAIIGFAQAALTVGLAFGLNWTPEQVGMLMAFAASLVALFGVHPNVTAVVAPDGSRVPKTPL